MIDWSVAFNKKIGIQYQKKIDIGNKLISSFMNNNIDEEILYNESFDLLIPVITEIGKLDFDERVTHTYFFDINGNGTTIRRADVIISSSEFKIIRHNSRDNITLNTFWAIIEFIEWYNEQIELKRDRDITNILN
tara:strand:+ start:45735 stop:46139 length:405 start_codon:yes stop_codon:yes gene_type:complete